MHTEGFALRVSAASDLGAWRWALVVALGLLAGGFAWFRLTRVTAESDPRRYWAREGAATYAGIQTVSLSNAEGVRDALAAAPVEDADGHLTGAPDALEALRRHVADYLLARFNAATAAEYATWMEAQGYRPLGTEEFERLYGPLGSMARVSGATSTDIGEVFTAMWNYPPSRCATPDAMGRSPEAIVIAVGAGNSNRPIPVEVEGALGHHLWYGGSTAKCRFWMGPPVPRDKLITRHRQILAAEIALILSVPGSDRRPLMLHAFYDPSTSRWWIDGVSVTNYVGDDDCWTCPEF